MRRLKKCLAVALMATMMVSCLSFRNLYILRVVEDTGKADFKKKE